VHPSFLLLQFDSFAVLQFWKSVLQITFIATPHSFNLLLMDAHTDWEALPPRKDRKVSAAQPSVRPTVAGYDQIMNNIEERRQRNQSVTTLASKDGCRGRFYECKRKVVVLISCTALTAFSAADLDHTADVQCHAWGDSMKHAFENMAQCMVNYMTDISLIHEDPREQITITVAGTPALL
jgi:hypothetical protein